MFEVVDLPVINEIKCEDSERKLKHVIEEEEKEANVKLMN